ncbi:type II toxin-antitoxin system PemK/MazF family toxin [Candidatus Pacebacteria bacterium]|nr:type II toxin-antitoxin system PemK/MazF family toxin [Candidatus Paceibacterota bacterium]
MTTQFMTPYDQGDIILVPFPFTDLNQVKKRPALVISKSDFNDHREDVIAVGVTSDARYLAGTEKDDEFRLIEENLSNSGLPQPSTVKLSKIVTLKKSLILKKFGTLSRTSTDTLIEKFISQF